MNSILHLLLQVTFVSILSLLLSNATNKDREMKRVCYFTSWSKYRPDRAKFTTDKVDPSLCTHLIFAFGDFDHFGNVRKLDNWHDSKDYEGFKRLKKRNPQLKTLLAIGGWNFRSIRFSNMAANTKARTTFVTTMVAFLKKHHFNGFDIDWEYPAERGGLPRDKRNLVTLCKDLKHAFTTGRNQAKNDRLLLTMAVPANQGKVRKGYDVRALSKCVDFFNIMTYDFHGSWDHKVGQNAPLFPSNTETSARQRKLNVRDTVLFWHSQGAPKHKLVVGLAGYGQTFTLSTRANTLGSPASKGIAASYTRQAGFWSYYEICMDIDAEARGPQRGQVHFDSEQQVPYYTKGSLWIGYDNERSIKAKARWVKEQGFGGIMFWSLDLDDFDKMCPYSKKRYPLLHAAIDGLMVSTANHTVVTTTTPAPKNVWARLTSWFKAKPTTTTTTTTTTPEPTAIKTFAGCPPAGFMYFPDLTDCRKYITCAAGRKFPGRCPGNLQWDRKLKSCNWPNIVRCRIRRG